MLKFAAKYCCKLKVAGSDSHYRVILDLALQSIFYTDGCFWELGEIILLIPKLVGNLPFSSCWADGVGSSNLHQQRTIIQDTSTAYQLGRGFWKSVPCGSLPDCICWAEPSVEPQSHEPSPQHGTPSLQQGFWVCRPLLPALGDSGKLGLAVYMALSAETSVRVPKDVGSASFIPCLAFRGSLLWLQNHAFSMERCPAVCCAPLLPD